MSDRPGSDVRLVLPDDLLEAIARRAAELVVEELKEPEWLTLDEAAVRYRTTPAALRWRAQNDRLPGAVKDSGRWLVNARALDSVLCKASAPHTEGRTRRGARPHTRR